MMINNSKVLIYFISTLPTYTKLCYPFFYYFYASNNKARCALLVGVFRWFS